MGDDNQPAQHLMSAAASRPALVPYLNVEMTVTIQVIGIGAMVSLLTNFFYGLIFTAVVLLFCRILTMIDDQAFRILGLWIRTRIIHFNFNRSFWKSSSYTSNKSRF